MKWKAKVSCSPCKRAPRCQFCNKCHKPARDDEEKKHETPFLDNLFDFVKAWKVAKAAAGVATSLILRRRKRMEDSKQEG